MFRRRPRRLPLALTALAVVVVMAVLAIRNGGTELTGGPPVRGTAVEAVYATGVVEPENWSRVGPVVKGRIAEVLVAEGAAVQAGQPLARMEDREALARVAELEARAKYWREELERSRVLAARGIRSREAEDKARSEYDAAVAAIAAARQRRLDLVVTAPRDGVVLRRDGEIGEVVDTTDTLYWIGEPRPLRITADVDEEDIARVRTGQHVLIKADAFPDANLTGTVDRITPKGDPLNKTFRIRVALPADTPLLIGMTTEINIVTAEKTGALLVPASAVADDRLFVVEDGETAIRPVKTGIRGRDRIEIVGGLAPTDVVVTSPPAGLKAGQRVRVVGD